MDDALPESWLRDILRFALKATASTPAFPRPLQDTSAVGVEGGGNLVDPKDPGKDPRFGKLVQAILFSRRLVTTYNFVLLGVLAVFTIWHWGDKGVMWWKKRRRNINVRYEAVGDAEAWSSSSSTIEGNVTPPNGKLAQQKKNVEADTPDETTALLSPSKAQERNHSSSWLRKPYWLLCAALQYQPSPIPIVNKTLPTNATSLLVLLYFGLTLFYNFYAMPLSLQYLFVFADRCGILFSANLPLLYLLAAKNQPIKLLTGYSYESLNIFHRRVGEVMCLEAVLHVLGMVMTWYFVLRRLGFTLVKFIFSKVVLLGLGAFIVYEGIYFTSLASFRKRWYETFLALHVVLQVAALAFLFFHHHTSRPYVIASLAIWAIDRIAFRFWLKASSHPATLTLLEDDETLLVSANWTVKPTPSETVSKFLARLPLPHSMHAGWHPNQHVFISVPALGPSHLLQSHPFTIYSAAPLPRDQQQESQHAWLSLLIRSHSPSGFSSALIHHARSNPQTRIRLDGPYGSSHALDSLQAADTAILVAGGSGIAVAYPLLYALLAPCRNSNSNNSNNKTAMSHDPESCATNTITAMRKKVKLLWITHHPTHRLWLPEPKLSELEAWGLDALVAPPTALAGRPRLGGVLEEWVAEEGRSTGSGSSGRGEDVVGKDDAAVEVVVSGPEGLVRDVRNACAGLRARGWGIGVGEERFGW